MSLRSLSLGCVLLGVVACGGDSATDIHTGSVTLTGSQAGALMTKIAAFAPLHSDIAWLADSANLVLRSGAVAPEVNVNTNLGTGPFYAVGLQRAVQTTPNSFSTFDVILFNDPSNPTDFIIVDGFKIGTAPPTSVSGSFGGATVNGHMFHVVGNSISAWRAAAGTASLATGGVGSACAGFQGNATVSCVQADLSVSFSIDQALPDIGNSITADRTAVLGATTVPGILLNFHF